MKKLNSTPSDHLDAERIGALMGKKIKFYRAEHKISRRALAKLTGISVPHIGKLENGSCKPTIMVCLKLAAVLKIQLSDIIREVEINQAD